MPFVPAPPVRGTSLFASRPPLCRRRAGRSVSAPVSAAADIPGGGDGRANGDRNGQADDAQLQRELREKVRELYGGSENVSILVTGDKAEFTVRKGPEDQDMSSYKSAVGTAASIVLMSVAAGLLFSFLYYTGAVHDSSQTHRRYDMPKYASDTYIDPYTLLEMEADDL